jgi:hypothetical protein
MQRPACKSLDDSCLTLQGRSVTKVMLHALAGLQNLDFLSYPFSHSHCLPDLTGVICSQGRIMGTSHPTTCASASPPWPWWLCLRFWTLLVMRQCRQQRSLTRPASQSK